MKEAALEIGSVVTIEGLPSGESRKFHVLFKDDRGRYHTKLLPRRTDDRRKPFEMLFELPQNATVLVDGVPWKVTGKRNNQLWLSEIRKGYGRRDRRRAGT